MATQEKTQPSIFTVISGHDCDTWTATIQRSMQTDDGYAYYATIYHAGLKVATARQDGHGGMTFVDWIDRNEERLAGEFVKTLPPDQLHGVTLAYDIEYFISGLCETAMEIKTLRRKAAKCVVMVEGDKFLTVNTPYTPESGARLAAKYPKATILNPLLIGGGK